MKQWLSMSILWLCLSGLALSQNTRTRELYGTTGLRETEEILSELDLPEWFWGGAHVYDNVERNYRSISGALLEHYFGKFPASGLNDPQHVLNDEEREKIEDLIKAHDAKSVLPLYVNILVNGQKLALDEGEMRERLNTMFKDKSALMVFYYYGYARGVRGDVLLDATGFVRGWEVEELFQKSAQDASIQVDDFAELEAFVREFSKRSFWLEQSLITPVQAETKEDKDTAEKTNLNPQEKLMRIINEHALILLLVLVTLIAAVWYYLTSSRWRQYVLPVREIPARLGANYGASVSDTVEFSDAKISLAEQHEKIRNRDL